MREAQGKSLRELAKRTGYDKAYISRVERGLQRPTVDFLRTIGRELGLRDLVDVIERFWPG